MRFVLLALLSLLPAAQVIAAPLQRQPDAVLAQGFLPGGRFEYNGYLETTMYNCTTTLFNPMTGTYRVEGGRLYLSPKTSKWQQRNNCAAGMNREQPGKLNPETYAIRFAEEQGGRRLCLTSSKGNEVCYRAE